MSSIRQRILSFYLITLGVVIALVLTLTLRQTYQHTHDQLLESFEVSKQVLTYKLENDGLFLKRSLETFAKDFNTKQLIAEGETDPESLTSALTNHKQRVNAQFVIATLNNGKVIADTSEMEINISPETYQQERLHFLTKGNQAFLVKSSPVKFLESAPTPDAWLTMGIGLHTLISQNLKTLVGSEIYISSHNTLLATTDTNQSVIGPEHLRFKELGFIRFTSKQQEWVGYRFNLSESAQIQGFFVVASDKAFLNYLTLSGNLAIIIAISIGIATIVTFYLTKAIVQPLRTLASVAERIKEGSYDSDIPSCTDTEVQKLASALSSMQSGIQSREAEINQLAFYDELTSLPNRNYFLKKISELIEQIEDKTILLLLIDLDRFKDINDTLGHDMGDQLLNLIGQRMQSFHFGSCFYAHLGGDEFGVLVWDIECFDQEALISQYEKLFQVPYRVEGVHLDIDASLGVALYPEHAQSVSGLMQCADIALYKCKGSHHHSAIYSTSMNTHSVQRLQLMSELRKAIETHQLVLYYQPKICLKSMSFVSVECLVRWFHPEHGFVGPDEFIPLAEQTGAIRDLTHWAIRTALIQQSEWNKSGLDISTAVNISAIDLVDLSLPPYVSQQLSELSVSPKRLTLEVTESAIMADPESAYQALNMLRRMGIKLSIDDFGTGYSSLGQLKKLPVDELKIDQSFVRELHHNKEDEIIIKSASDLSHNLGLSVVAEGVENQFSLDFLIQQKVDFAQGFFIAKPMPADKLWEWYQGTQASGVINASSSN